MTSDQHLPHLAGAFGPVEAVIFDFQGVLSRRGSEARAGSLLPLLERDLGLEPGTMASICEGLDPRCLQLKKPVWHRDSRLGALQERLSRALERPVDVSAWLVVRSRARLVQENIELLRALRGSYRVGLLANSKGRIEERLRLLGIRDLFDDVIDSAHVGIEKPDRRIYELAVRRLGCEPGACLLIDDRPENVVGASEAGMQALFYSYEDGDSLADLLAERGIVARQATAVAALSGQ